MAKTKKEWFRLYSESHRNPTNRLIHKVCVPAIVYAATGILWSIPPNGTFAVIGLLSALIFYFSLGGMQLVWLSILLYVVPNIWFWMWMEMSYSQYILPLGLGVFAIAWGGQFIGHHIEGKKPSFLEDLKFLLIGPIWILEK